MKILKVKKKDSTASEYFTKYAADVNVGLSKAKVASKLMLGHVKGLDPFLDVDKWAQDNISFLIDDCKEVLQNLEKVSKAL